MRTRKTDFQTTHRLYDNIESYVRISRKLPKNYNHRSSVNIYFEAYIIFIYKRRRKRKRYNIKLILENYNWRKQVTKMSEINYADEQF